MCCQRILGIIVRLASCLTGLDLTKQVKLLLIQLKQRVINPTAIPRHEVTCHSTHQITRQQTKEMSRIGKAVHLESTVPSSMWD